MKHTAITTDGQVIALEQITQYDMVGHPIPIDCTLKQFKKDQALWLEIFNKTWPSETDYAVPVGKMA